MTPRWRVNWHGPSYQLLGDPAEPDLVTLKMEVVPSSIISEYTFTTQYKNQTKAIILTC